MAAAAARELKRQREGDEVPSTAAMWAMWAGEAQYVYMPIADALKAAGARVCLFAAVSEIGAAFRSRGTDFTLTLRIADQSRTTGISVTFFANNTALLPRVKSSGDVISLHNVVVTMHCGELFVTFDKKSSSFALFEGKASTELRPYQTSIKYEERKQDDEILTNMRMWLAYHPPGLKDLELQLRSVKSDSTFDLVCKVLHVCQASTSEWIFYVWDGTDAPATEFQTFLSTEAFTSAPLHLEETPLPREVLCTLPCIGTVLRIFSNKFSKEILQLQRNVYWARFCNITCKQEFGIWKGTLLPSSRVRLLSNEDGSVVERLKMYDSRLTTQVHRQPMASLHKASDITEVEFNRAGYTTLMESLTNEQVTHKFKTLVRVVSAYPCQGSDLHSLLTGNHCLRLTLEDPTARIHAYVHKDDGVRFFGGFLTAAALTRKMNRLLGVPEPEEADEDAPLARNPPWIWCCLKSYRVDKYDPWGSRRYRIFGTEIRD
ncbi:hypothetical protein QYE76_044577 [Lolium multiflorum]|uniref:Telomeric single stranded DNA binding POT1/Cdc13 domain-containing protein n=1 Tax=Lolium multiflorum TaxID=4521 RepID=A0AAD8TL86_LOLMU|nr:hypothetical protein QYE76_044577 [Lolium multiflorum]